MELVKEREMKLLSRKRLALVIENKGVTPSRQELINQVAEKFKVKPGLVVIKHIYQQFGQNMTKLIVHIYEDEKKMKMYEHANLLKKHEAKVVPKAEEAPVEEKPAAEEKAEEKTE
jgi:ribosomal protein S24E